MAHDKNAILTVEELDRYTRERTGGNYRVVQRGRFIQLCRLGSEVALDLRPEFDTTESGIAALLADIV